MTARNLGILAAKTFVCNSSIRPLDKEAKLKTPPDLVYYQPRRNKPIRGFVSRLLYGDDPGANKATAADISHMLELLRSRYPDRLKDTSAFVGRPSLDQILNRMSDTQHQDTGVGRLLGTREQLVSALATLTDAGLEQFPTAYIPQGDIAILPESSIGVAMHELGHALDLNKPLERNGRYSRALKVRYKPSLLQEMDAWRLPVRGLSEAAAEQPDHTEFVRKVLGDAYRRRGPALGTYFGSAAGAVGGLGLGLAGMKYLPDGRIPVMASVIGSALGIPIGALIGKRLVSREGAGERYADKQLSKAQKSKEKRDKKELRKAKA